MYLDFLILILWHRAICKYDDGFSEFYNYVVVYKNRGFSDGHKMPTTKIVPIWAFNQHQHMTLSLVFNTSTDQMHSFWTYDTVR